MLMKKKLKYNFVRLNESEEIDLYNVLLTFEKAVKFKCLKAYFVFIDSKNETVLIDYEVNYKYDKTATNYSHNKKIYRKQFTSKHAFKILNFLLRAVQDETKKSNIQHTETLFM